jgi:hypothetical protein
MKNTLITVGLILALLGGAGLAFGSVPYQDDEVLLDAGPLEASASVEREWEVPPLLSGGALAAGLALVALGAAKRP